MIHKQKKPEAANFGLDKKTSASGTSFSPYDLKIPAGLSFVNKPEALGQPYNVLVCWLCGTDRDVLTVHKAGGVLGVCDRCGGGEV